MESKYMELALELAKKGMGYVNPNPLVGAVVVKNGTIIGEGWHERYGGLHAERNALANCSESPEGAKMYVNLEPCCHQGKTPPCTNAIIASGIRHVIIGSSDPNPLVAGKGIECLRNNGIEVTQGILKEECDKLNQVFFHFIKTKTPYVVMKYAMTMDGKIATAAGKSKWITGETAREWVHKDRHRYSGIMTGIGTVLADNPQLTCRLPNGRSPVRIICDSSLRTPLSSRLIQTANQYDTYIATCCEDEAMLLEYQKTGCRVISVPRSPDGHVKLGLLMRELGALGIDSLLLEGGSTLNWAMLEAGAVNKVQTYLSPKLFGGSTALSPLGGCGVKQTEEAYLLSTPVITRLGEDILLESEVLSCLQES